MAKKASKKIKSACKKHIKNTCSGGCGYFLGIIGAAVYYLSTATGFWNGVWGIIKALIWPAFLVFEVLKFIGA